MTSVGKPRQQWIGADADVSAPLFRCEFQCDRTPVAATLLISGLGYHEAWLNGERVGDHQLDPAQTDYARRVFFLRHDVTHLLCEGANAIGVILGNGWYNQDRVWGQAGLSYGQPRLMAELHLCYDKGQTDVIRADTGWRWASGPITDNNIYAGECYDGRLERPGWTSPGFDAAEWQKAVSVPPPGGELQVQQMPPMRRIETLQPVRIERKQNAFVVDLGQNFSGWVRIQVTAPQGTEIVMRFAETVFPDGRIDPSTTGVFATGVEQVDRYICRGDGEETWEPRFTYHGFRYVEVSGWPGELTADEIVGVVVHNDLPVAGTFESSDARLNRLHRMALWTHRSNCHGIPEDCPARERCGWLGDANLVAEYSMWNYDAKGFWEKFLGDIETTRAGNNGIPCNIAPGKRGTRGNANPDWAAAFIMVPWYLYLFSGDRTIIERHWAGMTQLMAHFQAEAEGWILSGGYGDFFDPGTDAIVQHTPQALTSTLWFLRCAEVMRRMAAAVNEGERAESYHRWRCQIAEAVKTRFYDESAGSFGSQAANVLALAFDVFPEADSRMLQALVSDIQQRDIHMNVGVMGVRFMLEVLTGRGHGELALALLRQNSYPSFGSLIERGATTLWECWGEEGHSQTHGPRSMSHPFMGGFDNWFYHTLAGIRPDPEAPGFERFLLKPYPVKGVDRVRCHHDSPYGRIESNWRRGGDLFTWKVRVPAGTTAIAFIPGEEQHTVLNPGDHHFEHVLPVKK